MSGAARVEMLIRMTLKLRALEANDLVCMWGVGSLMGYTSGVVNPCSGALNYTRSGCRQIWFV